MPEAVELSVLIGMAGWGCPSSLRVEICAGLRQYNQAWRDWHFLQGSPIWELFRSKGCHPNMWLCRRGSWWYWLDAGRFLCPLVLLQSHQWQVRIAWGMLCASRVPVCVLLGCSQIMWQDACVVSCWQWGLPEVSHTYLFEYRCRQNRCWPGGADCIGWLFLVGWCRWGVTCIHIDPFLCLDKNLWCPGPWTWRLVSRRHCWIEFWQWLCRQWECLHQTDSQLDCLQRLAWFDGFLVFVAERDRQFVHMWLFCLLVSCFCRQRK